MVSIVPRLKFIYIRLGKTGSTSLQQALHRLLGKEEVIGSIGLKKGKALALLRQKYKNYFLVTGKGVICSRMRGRDLQLLLEEEVRQKYKNHVSATGKPVIRSHMRGRDLQLLLEEEVWNSYLKVAVIRDPYDMLISHYYYYTKERGLQQSFEQFVIESNLITLENIVEIIHNEEGKLLTDYLIRYEHLEEDIGELERKIDCPELLKTFQGIREKGDFRPKIGTSSCEMYSNYPNVKRVIDEACREWADKGYDFFETYWPAYKAKLEQEMSEYKDSSQSQKESIIG